MHEIKFVRQNLTQFGEAMAARGASFDAEAFKTCDEKRRTTLYDLEELRHKRNVVSAQIADLKKRGAKATTESEDPNLLMAQMREVGGHIKTLEKSLAENEQQLNTMLMGLPNLPHTTTPVGRDESDNPVFREVGQIPEFPFTPLAHWDIGANLKILDFERAARITGSRFPLYFGIGAKLERALINFMLDVHTNEHGYTEVLPPFIVNRHSMTHTGQLPKFEEDLFKLADWDYYLIPTAEVPVTNIHAREIIPESQLPIYYTAYTPCFRSEAGSHGKDTRGLIRQHQFNKVELVKFTSPETSYDELETLLQNAETIIERLGLAYRVITLCTGDIGFSAAKTYDIEVWMPAQNVYREISSCSNFEAFQARRGNIRFKPEGAKKPVLVHTLNGSGLAVGRTLAAILENCQREDGSVTIPPALRPYMGGLEEISPCE